MAALRKIILSGELGKKFGREHLLAISTPGEAIRALCANFRDFASHLIESENRGVGYRVVVDKAAISDVDHVHNPFSRSVRIVPVVTGSKGGFFSVILGAALIAASFFLPGAALFTIGSFAPSLASIAFGLGTSMLLGGISQMLSPQPKSQGPQERPDNKPSYAFNGPVNTTAQGQCVPVGYGRLIVGSAVISVGLSTDEYSESALT